MTEIQRYKFSGEGMEYNEHGLWTLYRHLKAQADAHLAALEAKDLEWADTFREAEDSHNASMESLRRELAPTEPVLLTYRAKDVAALADSSEAVVIHEDFRAAFQRVCDIATDCGVQIHVTHSLRKLDQVLQDTVVAEALRSNHHAGSAVDLNVICDGEWFNSKKLLWGAAWQLPGEHGVKRFLAALGVDPDLRWGGNFTTPDPVHIDDNLVRRDPEEWQRRVTEIRGEG